jgi:hypothetical protein
MQTIDPKQSFGSIRLAYELTLTFQKIGAPNLRTPRTFLRMAVGWNEELAEAILLSPAGPIGRLCGVAEALGKEV